MNLYDYIFEKTYGFPLNELDEARSAPIRDSIIRLRASYRSDKPVTNYEDDSIRKAYMIAYYANYIKPAYTITKEILLKPLTEQNKLKYNISYFGAGPAPEAYGMLKAISESGFHPRLQLNMLDYEENWRSERKVTLDLIEKLENCIISQPKSISGCDLRLNCKRNCISYKECQQYILNSDVLFMQNSINHLGHDASFIDGIKQKFKELKENSFFVIIDFDYQIVKEVIAILIDYSSSFAKLVASNIIAAPSSSTSDEPIPEELMRYVFTGETGLIPKKYTRYYFAVFQCGM